MIALQVTCAGNGLQPLACRAVTTCVGSYGCTVPVGVDQSNSVTWVVDGPLRAMGGGRFESAGTGPAVVSATAPGMTEIGLHIETAVVLPGRQPLPSGEFGGRVVEQFMPIGVPATPVDDATVRIVDGVVTTAARSAVSCRRRRSGSRRCSSAAVAGSCCKGCRSGPRCWRSRNPAT